MAKLRRKDAPDGLMPVGGGGVNWWANRILRALEAGKTEVQRPPNSRRIVELMGMAMARRRWRDTHPNAPTELLKIID